jgi:VanZ family protein
LGSPFKKTVIISWLLSFFIFFSVSWYLMELAQGGFTATRNADWGDLLTDAVGAMVVVVFAGMVATLGSSGRGPFRSVEKGET